MNAERFVSDFRSCP